MGSAFSKNWHPTSDLRFQFRAEFIDAFNHTQWLADPGAKGLDNTCTASVTSCTVTSDRFGQIRNTRAPARSAGRIHVVLVS